MKNINFKKLACFLFLVLLFSFLFFPVFSNSALAQPDFGQEYAENTNLGNSDLRDILVRFVQIFFSFLAIIAVVMIIYGGFLWMTSAGNEEKISKAKKTLVNAIIGLILILSAFAIVQFVLNEIGSRIGQGGPGGDGSAQLTSGGFGAIGSCSVESVYPEPNQEEVPRNTSMVVTFKEEVDPSTVINGSGKIASGSVEIFKSEDSTNKITDVSATSTSDNKTFVFTPDDYLGSPSESIWYTVYMSNDIKNTNGDGIFDHCQNEFLRWRFKVSTELDLTPPKVNKVFPAPDDERDSESVTAALSSATGRIVVNNIPDVYSPASITSGVIGPYSPSVSLEPNSTEEGDLLIAVESDDITAVLTNNTSGKNLGSARFDGNSVTFPGVLTLNLNDSPSAGDSWNLSVEPVTQADTLTVAGDTYTFVSESPEGNQIQVGADTGATAVNIASTIDGSDDDSNPSDANNLITTVSGDTIDIEAEQAGDAGNDIVLESNDSNGDLDITPMSGGNDKQTHVNINDKEDEYRNSIIQINFNEPVNPMRLSGRASSLSDYIKIVNATSSPVPDGGVCDSDNDCVNFNCDSGTCSGSNDYLPGEFMLSNQYRTVEFRSDNQCGVNSCGQDVYCLPGNSRLKVEFVAARLKNCGSDSDCTHSPYNSCIGGVCADDNGTPGDTTDDVNYPAASGIDGVLDMSMNSLDGDSDGSAEGRGGFYDKNGGATPVKGADILGSTAADEEDSFAWSFWINDEMKIGEPRIVSISPGDLAGFGSVSTDYYDEPVKIGFDSVMRSGSLKTGHTMLDTGDEEVPHKNLNIWNYSGDALGYWITKKGVEDEAPIDGYPNRTDVFINHSSFKEAVTYRSQVGSGVMDIYQNCFKPSGAETGDCSGVNEANPSCCNGTITTGLDSDGNCP